jgi:hypothetical protein
LADFQIADRDRADANSDQFEHLTADRFDHAPNLTVAAFVKCDFDVRIAAGIADPPDGGRARRAVAEFDAAAELFESFVAEN